jgi:hypothetical protein
MMALLERRPLQLEGPNRVAGLVVWFMLALGVVGAHALAANDGYGPVAGACAGAIAVIFLTASLRYWHLRIDRLPWLETMLGVHYAQFGLAVFGEPTAPNPRLLPPAGEACEQAAFVALGSAGALVLGYALIARMLRNADTSRFLPPLTGESLDRGARIYVPLTAAYVVGSALLPEAATHYAVGAGLIRAVFWHGQLVVVAVTAYLAAPGRKSGLRMALALAVMGGQMLWSSSLSELCIPLLAAAAIWWRQRRALPWAALAAVAAVLLILQPVKGQYRQQRFVEGPRVGVVEAWIEAFQATYVDRQGWGRTDGQKDGSDATVERLSGLSGLAYAMDVVPDTIPHTGGAIYEKMLVAAVPRLLWPDKPDMTKYALDPFVIAMGLASAEETEHSTAGLTLPAQGYLEHGVVGSLAWMALFGAVLALAAWYCGRSLAGVVVGGCLLTGWILGAEGGFFSLFGGLWQSIAATTTLVWGLWWTGRQPRLPTAHEIGSSHDTRDEMLTGR